MARDTDPSLSKPVDAEAAAAGTETRAWIPMSDGVRLAATLYLPDRALGPQPCIIEALPYRKDDLTSSYAPEYVRLRDEHSYAVCRIDVRGTGSSGGDAVDEYPEQEQRDLAQAMTWIAAQEWCDGAVGMYGTSYSGFNSLQLACERPPELKAIIAIFATDDRYTDDVQYRGGALKFLDLVDYKHYMTPMNALPPTPAVWGDGWRDEWRRRIDANEPWLLTWLRHQRDGAYWRQGSVRPDYERIACPTMIVAGWADGYRNNSFRIVERLRDQGVPHHLLAGPWAHASTESSLPGPRIDLVPVMAQWWDRWLRADDAAGGPLVLQGDAPATTLFVRTSTRPEPDLSDHAGFWTREEWPSPRSTTEQLALDARPPYAVDPAVGVDAWIDCAGVLPWGQSGDQRYDDAASLTWDFDAGERTIVGHPVARLSVSADQPVASLSVKLCDVFADGCSALVARGSLNLTHRDSHADPAPLVPGEVYEVDVELDACAYRFDPGQRLRLSVAGADWPNTAAPPTPVTLTLHGGTLTLPLWSGPSPYEEPRLPGPRPEADSTDSTGSTDSTDEGSDAETPVWAVSRDVLTRVTEARVDHGSTYDIPNGGSATERYVGVVGVDRRTHRQTAHADTTHTVRWPEATVACHAVLDLTADDSAYRVSITLEATEDDEIVGRREWHETIPRDLA
jgi:putative CocE/NonD family hydrolase